MPASVATGGDEFLAGARLPSHAHENSPIPFKPPPPTPGEPIACVDDLLRELDLRDLSIGLQLDELEEERPKLLSQLRNAGVSKIGHRQSIASALMRARRAGRVKLASPPAVAAPDREPLPPGMESISLPAGRHVRVFAVSDVHADHKANMSWLGAHLPAPVPGGFDVCLCPGDVSDNLGVLASALSMLKQRFDEVVFTVGNHDLWVDTARSAPPERAQESSLDKLARVESACASLGVRTRPLYVRVADGDDVLIVPLYSWYHSSWDAEPELPDEPMSVAQYEATWTDFYRCRWPPRFGAAPAAAPEDGGDALAAHFASLNDDALGRALAVLPRRPPLGRAPPRRLDRVETYARYGQTVSPTSSMWTSVDPERFFTPRDAASGGAIGAGGEAGGEGARRGPFVISMSHFVPRQELLPEKRMLLNGFLHRVSGSAPLEAQLRRLMPDVHVFGHTHLLIDLTIDGVRYVQWPLGTPREQKAQTRESSHGLMRLYDGADGGEAPQHWTHWGRHYELYARDTSKTDLAPWALKVRQMLTPRAAPAAAGGYM